MRKRMIACLAGLMAIGFAMVSLAAEPWSLVDGQFIGSDGKALNGVMEKGISISKYQNRAGEINWKKFLSQDITFAMIRLGYADEKDSYFDENMKNAAAHGVKTGVVFYTKALTKEKIEEEARYVLDTIKDYPVSYPVALDVESQYMMSKGLTKQQVTEQINSFCKVITDAGYSPVIYGNYELLTKSIDTSQMPYHIWYARYGAGDKFNNRTMWQATDAAKVDGVKGLVCLEFAFSDYSKLFPGTAWREINGTRYYFENYEMVKSALIDIEGTMYRFDNKGLVQ